MSGGGSSRDNERSPRGGSSPASGSERHDELRCKPRSLIQTPLARQKREESDQLYVELLRTRSKKLAKKARPFNADHFVYSPINTMDKEVPTAALLSRGVTRSVSCDDVFETDRKQSADSGRLRLTTPRKLQLAAVVDDSRPAPSRTLQSQAIKKYLTPEAHPQISSLPFGVKKEHVKHHVLHISDDEQVPSGHDNPLASSPVVAAAKLLYPDSDVAPQRSSMDYRSCRDLTITGHMIQMGLMVKALSESIQSIRCQVKRDFVQLTLFFPSGTLQEVQFATDRLAQVSLYLDNSSSDTTLSYVDFIFGQIPSDVFRSFGVDPGQQSGIFPGPVSPGYLL